MQEVCLPVLDDLVRDYANGVMDQATGAWQQCDAMRQALIAGDVDTGLAVMREVCPAALEDVRLVFRAKKQKFVELLKTGGDPEAALACARSELAPLALDAYPEAYVEFKRLLLLLLLVPTAASPPRWQQQQQQQQQQDGEPRGGKQQQSSGLKELGAAGSGGSSGVLCGAESAGLWDPGSTARFADLAYFTVRSMLGLQQPLMSLQLRFLLRLHGAHPASTATPGGALAAELGPRLRAARGGSCGGDRDPQPLPPRVATGGGGGGGGPPVFPESSMQAVIQGAGTSRQAATDAMKRSGGDMLSAFKAEVGRLRLNEQLLAELALEYGRFRGLLSIPQIEALEARAANTAQGSAPEPPLSSSTGAAAAAATATAAPAAVTQHAAALPPPHSQQQQQQQQQGPDASEASEGAGRLAAGDPRSAAAGPLAWARGGASRGGASPPSKVARRSPPSGEGVNSGEGGGGGGGTGEGGDGGGDGAPEMDVEMGMGPEAAGRPEVDPEAAAAAAGGEGGSRDRSEASPSSGHPVAGSGGASGSRSGSGCGSGGSQRLQGQEVLTALLRLGQEGDAAGVLALVDSVDPRLWAEHPHLLFDLRRCQYGKLLTEGQVAAALELARRELAPLASANPTLLPLLKSAMAALLPSPPTAAAAAGPPSGPATAAAPPVTPPPPAPVPMSASPFDSLLPVGAGRAGAAASAEAASAVTPAAVAAAAGTSAAAAAPAAAAPSPSPLLPSLPAVVGAIQALLQPRLGLRGPRLVRLMEGLLASHRAWMRSEKMSADPFAEPLKIAALRAATAGTAAGQTAAAAATAAAVGMAQARHSPGTAGSSLPPPPPPLPPPPPPLPAGMSAGLGLTALALERALREAGEVMLQPWYDLEQQILAEMRGEQPRTGVQAGPGRGAAGVAGAIARWRVPSFIDDDDERPGGAGGGGSGVPVDDDDDDDSSGGDGGMDVDEEGVLRLMEILELPRGAAVELLQNHDGDVQAAILSVM